MKLTITLFAAGILLVCSAKAQLPNAGMETWRNYTVNGHALEAPNGWYGFDSTLHTIANTFDGERQLQKVQTCMQVLLPHAFTQRAIMLH